MKVYFDVCCLNRPFDDQSQDKIRLEAEAILAIIKHIDAGTWSSVSSDTVVYEINNTTDEERRDRLLSINDRAKTHITVGEEIFNRTTVIKEMGFTTYDAMHIACAETAQVDIFLSTDKGIVNRASRNMNDLLVKIMNPLNWIQEEF